MTTREQEAQAALARVLGRVEVPTRDLSIWMQSYSDLGSIKLKRILTRACQALLVMSYATEV